MKRHFLCNSTCRYTKGTINSKAYQPQINYKLIINFTNGVYIILRMCQSTLFVLFGTTNIPQGGSRSKLTSISWDYHYRGAGISKNLVGTSLSGGHNLLPFIEIRVNLSAKNWLGLVPPHPHTFWWPWLM